MDSVSFSPSHKAPPRKGRRANLAAAPDDDFGLSDELETTAPGSTARIGIISSPIKLPADAPPKSRKTGGWADEMSTSKSGKSRRSSTNLIEQERFQQTPDPAPKLESDDDIPLIPDLDELQDEEMLTQVARAPSVVGSKVASFTELDSDLMKKSAFSTLDDINLGIISCHLYPEDDVKEDDCKWTWDLLFTEVASDLRTEWEDESNPDVDVA
ncbi:intraflagellar transport 43 [Lycorma delicatula]|uniref:intraflagellar transport 43 n=1 Tax=Lycorma delicatula TaxID=130591 RepID=UPI003F519152